MEEEELEDFQEQPEEDPDALKADLFGDDADQSDDADAEEGLGRDEDYQVEEDRGEDRGVQPSAGDNAAASRKALLAQLAQKKKLEAEGGDDDAKKGKKKKSKDKGEKEPKDKGEKGKRKRAEKTVKAGSRPGTKRPKEVAEDIDPAEREVREQERDRNFIDDDGVPQDERYGSESEDPDQIAVEEAEEVPEGQEELDEFDQLVGKNKRRKYKESDAQLGTVVDDKVAKMEAAAEEDMEQHDAGRPAVQKLKMLSEVEEFLAQRKYHEMFINVGGLGVLKAWLEPYKDGSLPNVRVRSAMLKICKALPIDTAREDIKSSLKKSMLGSRVMFLAKCPDESQTNRALARDLVQQWSRPIFFDPEVEAEKRKLREEQLRIARQQQLEASKVQEAEFARQVQDAKKVKPGEAGYRWHAAIPMVSKLDYVMEPTKDESALATAAGAAAAAGGGKQKDSRLDKKMREVQRKQKNSTARAMQPSVEGRGIVVFSGS